MPECFRRLQEGFNPFEFVPNGENRDKLLIMHYNGLSVRNGERRVGLAKELIKQSLILGEKVGCDLVTLDVATFEGQILFERLGFKTIKIIHLKDVRDSDGKQLITDSGKTTCIKLMIMPINFALSN